ncbi:MAG TPA: FAD-dependent oxidoreductase, partial [Caldilineaceae bacterium]|nr:FAD-dependent oxidoreductase [Caldilineaceae bacterium]
MHPDMRPRFDVVVLGGGPAGTAAAMRLARAGAKTLLAHRPPRRPARHAETVILAGAALAGLPALPSYGVQSSWGGPALLDHDFITTIPGTTIPSAAMAGLRWHVD